MALVSATARDPNARVIALAMACGVPFAAYLATASAHSFWLDGGELSAQAIWLDIAHPPGHPLAGLWGALFTLIPLGPLPFRVAIGQATAAAAAAGFLYAALDTTVRGIGARRDRVAIPLALGGTWLVACSYGWWFQAVRPEVYALEALLVAIAIERFIALEAAWPTHDMRPLYVAALALGLGLANHHFVAFLALPALAPTLARVYRARGGRPLLRAGLALTLGLAAYVYLPVRAATDPPMNLGDPTDPARLLWVVSAKVYAKNANVAIQPLDERLLDAITLLGENLGQVVAAPDATTEAIRALVVLGLVILGAYAALRARGVRRIGVIWVVTLVVSVGGRAWLGAVQHNPDVLGYLMPGLAAAGALVTILIATVLVRLGHRPDGTPRPVAVLVAVGVAALGAAQVHASAPRASLVGFHATDDFDEARVRRLPPNAVVVATRPQTVFRHWDLAASEGARPDVTLVPMPFLRYPGVVDAVTRGDPDVAELVRGYLLEGELRQPDLQSLAARRPLLVELDVRVPRELYETLVPSGLYYEVVDGGATDTDVLEAAGPHQAEIDLLYQRLGPDEPSRYETRGHLSWIHYMDALYYASLGARQPARESIERGLRLVPGSPELEAIGAALAEGEGPIDVTPFVVGQEPTR